jgi:hypothetical protein
MSCVNLNIPAPQIPPILLGLPAFTVTFTFPPPIPVGISCCHFTLPSFQIPINIPIPLPSVYFVAINALLQAAFALLTLNIPDCPMNGASL